MALSLREIQKIHNNKLATAGKKYWDDTGKVYIGTSEGRLRQLDKAEVSPFRPGEIVESRTVQKAIEEVATDINEIKSDYATDTKLESEIEKARCYALVMSLVL